VYAMLVASKKLSKNILLPSLAALVVAGTALLYSATMIPTLRQAVFHSSPGDASLTEGSTDQHVTATLQGADRVVREPLGCGVGCAGPASYYGDAPRISENYFVQIAEEVGVLGLFLFLVIVGLIAYQLYSATQLRPLSRALFAALCGYVVIGLFLHVWSDDPLSITWWMLAGAVIGYNESEAWIKSKDSLPSRT
jgi:hypothetical protein